MDQAQLNSLAERYGQSVEKAVKAAKVAQDDPAETARLLDRNIYVLKGGYAAKTNQINGAFVLIIDSAKAKIVRLKLVATYDPEFSKISLDAGWPAMENMIFETHTAWAQWLMTPTPSSIEQQTTTPTRVPPNRL